MESRHAEKTERRGWFGRLHLSWPMLFLAGWLLYEFTAQPGLAALVACAKFGWADLRTALWLRRVDPDRGRGRTCFWAYLTYGLWKVAVMATLTMIALGLFSALFDRAARPPQPNNGISPVFGGALAAAAIGFGLSFPTTYIALWSALRNGVRLWLGHAPVRARKERFWPPHHGGLNAAPFVGFTGLILTLWLIVFTAGVLAAVIQPAGVEVLVFLLGTLAAIILAIVLFFRISLRTIARSPQECWIAVEDEEAYQVRGTEERMSEA
jgi:hypothetical protein